jgi:cell fate (sporulation/competence/biofilm development) regulator YlbF (YheA/YmcA/DUF963 family)
MNHYDYAHNLACALKESDEYQDLLKARKELEGDAKNKEMLLELRRLQWDMQKAQVLQKEVDEVTRRRIEQLGELAGANRTIQEYLKAEYRFGQIMADIQKILSDALSDWFNAAAEFIADEGE